MKKFILFFALLMGISFITEAQSKKEKQIKDKIADEACECIKKSDADLENEEDLKLRLGLCLMRSLGEHQEELEKAGIDISSQEAIGEIGEDIGMLMATKCPSVFMGLVESDLEEENDSKSEEIVVQRIEGNITKVEENKFVTIIIKDENGRSHSLVWLEFFENADEVKENYDNLKDKSVEIEYYEKEYYNPKIRDYVRIKVLKKVEFK